MSTTTFSQEDTLANSIKLLSINQEHNKHSQQGYYYMDNYSDSTVAIKDTRFSKNPPQCQKNHHREKTSHSFTSNNNNSGCNFDNDIFQSPHIETKKVTTRFSFIKRVKRLFNKKKQPSLPVLMTAQQQQWNPSIDSISSSATLVRPDQTSIHSSQSSYTQDKSIFRHSCGITASPLFHRSQKQKRYSTKGILKEPSPVKYKPPPIPTRPTSLVMEQKKKRWSNARLSIYEHQTPTKKRYTVLSMMSPQQQNRKTQGVRFNKYVRMHETYSKADYDRSSDTEAVCNRLTPEIAREIKQELNEYKTREMVVHEHSRIHNHLFL